ncbi:MAG: MFS transporter [Dehalococcoidia bacterium]|nr:MFS transporter [Dehalococcoidia bacterium]
MTELATPPQQARRNRFMLAQWAELMDDDSFRRFWFMRLASHICANALSYALLVFTIRLSESAVAMGLLLLTMLLPTALLGAVSGVAVDRLPRGLILFAANLLRAVLVFALLGAKDSLPSLYMVSLGLGVLSQLTGPAEGAVVPHIVRSRHLVAANSFLQLGTLASQVIGLLVLAPLLLKTTNGDPLLFILVGLYVVSAGLVTLIPQFHFTSEQDGREVTLRAMRREFAEGWMRLNRDPTAFLALILLVVTSTSMLIIATMLPKFSVSVLGVAPENIVFVLAPVGIAVFLGLRSVEFLADRLNKLVTISGAYVLMAGSLIAMGLVPASAGLIESLDPLGVFSAGPLNEQAARIGVTILYGNIYGFALTVVLTMGKVLLNQRIPLAMQGRVFAAQAVLTNLVAMAPVVIASLVADAVGVAPVMICAGIGALLAAAWSQARSSRIAQPIGFEADARTSV